MQKEIRRFWPFLKANILLVLIVCLAAFLRTYRLDTHGILFYDAAHDLLSAHQAIEDKRLPLVGITSSRPWLHQGPLSIWIEMLVLIFFGNSTYAQSVVFALIAIAAIIALYELITIHLNKQAAYFAVALFAVMPLAVAHSRVPYHTTPIPLALALYLFALLEFWKSYSAKKLLLTILTGLVLFQFELSNAPLLILVPYVFWRKRYPITRKLILPALGAIAVGLLPQFFTSLTGRSNQLIEFIKWAVTQIGEVALGGSNFVGKFPQTLQAFWIFWGRIFGVDAPVLTVLGIGLVVGAFGYALWQWKQKKLPPVIELTTLSFVVLTAAYIVAAPPSEAYFPPYFIIFAILLGYFFTNLPKKLKAASVVLTFIFIVVNTVQIFSANFFVLNELAFRYDSTGEHRQIAHFLAGRANSSTYQLRTGILIEESIPAFFDHIKWFAVAENLAQPGDTGRIYYVEGMDQRQPSQTIELKRFPTKVVYWAPQALPQPAKK